MRIPNWHKAVVSRHKIEGYLLSARHPHGRHKAAFFASHGFASKSWRVLVEALRRHAEEHPASGSEDTPFGRRYSVDGPLSGPTGRSVPIRSVWFIETGDDVPRFVTAYPLRREKP